MSHYLPTNIYLTHVYAISLFRLPTQINRYLPYGNINDTQNTLWVKCCTCNSIRLRNDSWFMITLFPVTTLRDVKTSLVLLPRSGWITCMCSRRCEIPTSTVARCLAPPLTRACHGCARPARGRRQPGYTSGVAAPAFAEGAVAMAAPGLPEGGGGLVIAKLPPLRRADLDERVQLRSCGHRRVVGMERCGEHRAPQPASCTRCPHRRCRRGDRWIRRTPASTS